MQATVGKMESQSKKPQMLMSYKMDDGKIYLTTFYSSDADRLSARSHNRSSTGGAPAGEQIAVGCPFTAFKFKAGDPPFVS